MRILSNAALLRIGLVGSAFAALCCFTPLLVFVFGAIGLSAWLGWIDVVLLPALGMFGALTLYALWRRRSESRTGV